MRTFFSRQTTNSKHKKGMLINQKLVYMQWKDILVQSLLDSKEGWTTMTYMMISRDSTYNFIKNRAAKFLRTKRYKRSGLIYIVLFYFGFVNKFLSTENTFDKYFLFLFFSLENLNKNMERK